MKTVSMNEVSNFVSENINSRLGSHGLGVTGSYLQDNRHEQVSERFAVIQPASVGAALAEQGFELSSLITGKGRHEDKKDFQRTIARYRSKHAFEIEGLSLDIIYISKHLGRGCDELRLGLYRGVCANQWAMGTLFNMVRFRHTGNPLADIQDAIAAVLSQRGQLIDTIKKMQGITLKVDQIDALCKKYADIRLESVPGAKNVNYRSLATVRRADDAKLDLFTVANVLQENIVRFPLSYQVESHDGQGNAYMRNQSTRRFRESSAQLVDLNGKLFDAAMQVANGNAPLELVA